jgi:hypothetical protein
MHVDEPLSGLRLEQRVAARGHLAETCAESDDEVGLAHALLQVRTDPDADLADVLSLAVIQ